MKLPRILADVSALVAGGYRRIFFCGVEAMRILVVEDDRKVADFIRSGLGARGLRRGRAARRPRCGRAGRVVDYDAVVLDLMLPGRSGLQVLRDIRARKPSLPVLILTAQGLGRGSGARARRGADDYMAKPFALAELSARLRALLRRGAPRETGCGWPISRWTRCGASSRAAAGRSI